MATSIQKGSEQVEEIYKNTGTEPIDQQALLDKYNAVTAAQFNAQREANRNAENAFYNQMYNTQKTAMDTIRQSNAAAVSSGASRGVQAAQELSSLLGLQQESVASATELAQANRQTAAEETAAVLENVLNATTQSQEWASNRAQQAIEAGSVNVQEALGLIENALQATANNEGALANQLLNQALGMLGGTNTGTNTGTGGIVVEKSGIQADGSLAFSTADLNENNTMNIYNVLQTEGYRYKTQQIFDINNTEDYDKIKQADISSSKQSGEAAKYLQTIRTAATNGEIPVGAVLQLNYGAVWSGNDTHLFAYLGNGKFARVNPTKDFIKQHLYIPKGYSDKDINLIISAQ